MATSLKTIEYAFPMFTQVQPDNTALNMGTINVYIPETNNRVFKGFKVEVSFQDVITATGGTIVTKTITLNIGGNNATYIDSASDTHSGENISLQLWFDFVTHANRFFGSGTSQTCSLTITLDQTTGTTLGMNNITAKLIITYEYDTNSTTQIKTVRIPFQSPQVGITGNSPYLLGTIPNLSTYLPEEQKNFRDYFITFYGNQSNTGAAATNYALGMNLSSTSPISGGYQATALQSSCLVQHIWNLTGELMPNTGQSHDVYIYLTGVTAGAGIQTRFNHICGLLTLTYEYNESNTTNVFNSLTIPLEIDSPVPGNFSTSGIRFSRNFIFTESGIDFKQSAIQFNYNAAQNLIGTAIRCNNQEYVRYTHVGGLTTCGGFCLMHDISSGSIGGNAFTDYNTGTNFFSVDIFASGNIAFNSFNSPSNLNGLIYLNYTSNKHPLGSYKHPHSVYLPIFDSSGSQNKIIFRLTGSGLSVNIPENNFYLFGYGYNGNIINSTSLCGFNFRTKIETDEYPYYGWRTLYSDFITTDPEIGYSKVSVRARDDFKRYIGDPDNNRLTFGRNRIYCLSTNANFRFGLEHVFTYHNLLYLISGNITNYTGDGSNITVDIYRTDLNEKALVLNTSVGGMFTGIWFDQVTPLYAMAYQDSTHYGRSDITYALPLSNQ